METALECRPIIEVSDGQAPKKHHYIPQCYSKAWTIDGKLVEYRVRHNGLVRKSVSPAATGFKDNLYAVYDVPPDLKYILETRFFKLVDQTGSDALDAYRAPNPRPNVTHRFSLARFMLCLIHRNPEHLQFLHDSWDEMFSGVDSTLRDNYSRMRRATDPETYEEAAKTFDPNARGRNLLSLVMKVSESKGVIEHLANMEWVIVEDETQSLLTSDRPIAFLPRDQTGNDIAFALSPRRLLVLTRDPTSSNPNFSRSRPSLFRLYNQTVCSQAAELVFAANGDDTEVVRRRLGNGRTQFIGDISSPIGPPFPLSSSPI